MKNIKALLAATVSLLAACSSLSAATVYTESFSSNNSSWTQNDNTASTWVSSGGVGGVGDGYITTTFTVPAGVVTGNAVVARASLSANASGGNFAGNYASAGITTISFSLKTDSAFALPIGLRLGGSAGAGMTITGGLLAPGSSWTEFTFDLSSTNPNILSFEGTLAGSPGATNADKFAAVMANVVNLQIFLNYPEAGYVAPGSNTPVTFSVDAVKAVPEPSTYAMMALGLGSLVVLRRCKMKQA